jgi:hypothetical protein
LDALSALAVRTDFIRGQSCASFSPTAAKPTFTPGAIFERDEPCEPQNRRISQGGKHRAKTSFRSAHAARGQENEKDQWNQTNK